jgi:DNA polymerase-3 subunit alpha
MSDFVHLHVHSEYSLLDGMSRPEEIAQIAKRNNQSACGITDHGTMAGTLQFQQACTKHGIKPIFGCEFYYVPTLAADSDDKKAERFHLIIHAKNQTGLHKLFQVMQKSWTTGFYHKPRIEWADLEFLAGDVVVLSGCMGSHLSKQIMNGEEAKAEQTAKQFYDRFGSDYYLELQPWNDANLNKTLLSFSDAMGIKAVGTLDCHYPTLSDRGIEEVLLCVAQVPSMNASQDRHLRATADSAKKERDLVARMNMLFPDRRLRFDDIHPYLMGTDEVAEYFSEHGWPQPFLLENTLEVADKCNAEIETGRKLLPSYSKILDSAEYLSELAEWGLQEKGLNNADGYMERLNEELGIIKKLDFSDYFLIIWDIIKWADSQGIARGPARGSVGGSLLAYALDITTVDPLVHNLLFARFISDERNDYPDIDLDFDDRKRYLIKQYIKDKWGSNNVASISTFGEFKAKSIIKDVSRVFGVPYDLVNKMTPLFETIEEFQDKCSKFSDEYPDILTVARRIEGRIRTAGAHAAGVVVSNIPLWQVCPIESRSDPSADGRVEVIGYDMVQAEQLGLIKFDILGVKAIAVVDDTIKAIKERHNIDVSKESVKLDDERVYLEMRNGNTLGVFQAEASAYTRLLLDLEVQNFSDLTASNALVRPGAMLTQGEQYIACKNHGREVEYHHPMLEGILKDTYGTFIYQEQLMQTVVMLADFSWSEADKLRKIIGKKRDGSGFDVYKDKFLDNASKHIERKAAAKMWEDFEKAALYSFNKSHAVGYSILTYQTMWLKINYPLEYMWALLANENEKERISTLLLESNRVGIDIQTPDINKSDVSFSLDGDSIRFGLSNIRGVGKGALDEILRNRPFSSFEEFNGKCRKTYVRSTVVENITRVGGFESIGYSGDYDTKQYYLSILNYPIHANDDKTFAHLLTDCSEINIDENEYHFMRGLTKSTARKPHYFRVEIEDSTSSVTGFGDVEMNLKTREHIYALVGDKSLIGYCATDEPQKWLDAGLDELIHGTMPDTEKFAIFLNLVNSDTLDNLSKELLKHGVGNFDEEKSFGIVVRCRIFTTKAGKIMASLYMYDPAKKQVYKIVVFNKTLNSVIHLVRHTFLPLVYRKSIRNSDIIFEDAISLEKFKELKGITS